MGFCLTLNASMTTTDVLNCQSYRKIMYIDLCDIWWCYVILILFLKYICMNQSSSRQLEQTWMLFKILTRNKTIVCLFFPCIYCTVLNFSKRSDSNNVVFSLIVTEIKLLFAIINTWYYLPFQVDAVLVNGFK